MTLEFLLDEAGGHLLTESGEPLILERHPDLLIARAGRAPVESLRIVGSAVLIGPVATVSGQLSVRIVGSGRISLPAASIRGQGALRFRGAGVTASVAGVMSGRAAVANPGEWVILVEAESGDEIAVVASQ